MEDIGLLLTYLETEINEGRKTLVGNGVVVDKTSVLDLIRRIRVSLPYATGEVQVQQAQREAQEIIRLAEARRAELIDNSMAMMEAKSRAEKIMKNAAENKRLTEQELEQNVTAVLTGVKDCLGEASRWLDNATKVVQEKLKKS